MRNAGCGLRDAGQNDSARSFRVPYPKPLRRLFRVDRNLPEGFVQWQSSSVHHESFDPLWKLEAYRLARFAVTRAWDDSTALHRATLGASTAVQLWRAMSTVPAQIAEGYSRSSLADRLRFLEYALGSVRESIAWYGAAALILPKRDMSASVAALISLRRLLLVMIASPRTRLPRKPAFGTRAN